MAKRIHYEVFVQRAGSVQWVLHEPHEDRAQAMNAAKYALLQQDFSGAKVVKETQNLETGEYQPITIFEEGLTETAKRSKEDVKLPCVRPQDLYTAHARALIGRVLEDSLDRWGVTVKELLHRADLLEELQASGTVLQHAMQKWAVTQSTSQNLPVTELMKQLGDLVARGMERVFRDDRAKMFPKIKSGKLPKAWEATSKASERGYAISGGIAKSLTSATRWSDKLSLLLSYMENLPADPQGHDICLNAIDDFVAEMIGGRAAMEDLLGKQPDLGASIKLLVDLFLGDLKNPEIANDEGLARLAKYFGEDKLTHSKTAVITRVLGELNSMKRLSPTDIKREVELTRLLAKRMVLCQGPLASIEDIVDAFEKRCNRLTNPEVAEEYMSEAVTPDERIDLLLDLEDNIIGGGNKAKLVSFIAPILTGPKMEPLFLDAEQPILRRLSRLASLQARVLKSGFPELEKEKIAEDFDGLSAKVEASAKLFHSISGRKVNAAEKAMTLLRLLNAGVLTKGSVSKNAARHIASYMKTPGFRKDLEAVQFPEENGVAPDPVEEFRRLMAKGQVQSMLKEAS